MICGRVHSLQSLGTLDGPGVRFVVFMQGCPLRCACCHNPDTWQTDGGTVMTAASIVEKAARYREYFGEKGGITLSGGEPLLQPAFAAEIFRLCHQKGIHTCLDTSGCLLNDAVLSLLSETDCLLLDIKYTEDELYQSLVGCSLSAPLAFLQAAANRSIPTVLRQVIIPGKNDHADAVRALVQIKASNPNVSKIELLPFQKLCSAKYEALAIPFPLQNTPVPTKATMELLNRIIEADATSS